MAEQQTSEVLDKIKKAQKTVVALCHGDLEWIMSIPCNEDRDPDLVIGSALRTAKTEITQLRAQIKVCENFKPDAEHINALPKALFEFIRDLETQCDPAGNIAVLILIRDQNEQFLTQFEDQKAQIEQQTKIINKLNFALDQVDGKMITAQKIVREVQKSEPTTF